jgi:hypothetical protein
MPRSPRRASIDTNMKSFGTNHTLLIKLTNRVVLFLISLWMTACKGQHNLTFTLGLKSNIFTQRHSPNQLYDYGNFENV